MTTNSFSILCPVPFNSSILLFRSEMIISNGLVSSLRENKRKPAFIDELKAL
jgi:hypothetical protein